MATSERDLIESAQRGDLRAFDELVGLHQSRVYVLARRMLGDGDDAADVQQETFVRAWRSLKGFRGEAGLATWLHRITVNLCLARRRRRKPELTIDAALLTEPASPGPGAVACIVRAELAVKLREALAAMPAHHRALIVLREIEDRPFEEIARILGCSATSARTRACKARKLLREKMRPYLMGESR